jgi:hypothetical protein
MVTRATVFRCMCAVAARAHSHSQVALVYTLTRMYVNVSQAYFPFYILSVQHMQTVYISVLPMVIYLTSFVVSNATSFRCINRRVSRKVSSTSSVCVRILTLTGVFRGRRRRWFGHMCAHVRHRHFAT